MNSAAELARVIGVIRDVLPGLEEMERALLVGNEGCMWPVEILRSELSNHAEPKP